MDYQLNESFNGLEDYFYDTFFYNGFWINGNIVNRLLLNTSVTHNEELFFIDAFGNIIFYEDLVLNSELSAITKKLILNKYQSLFNDFFDAMLFNKEVFLFNTSYMSFLKFSLNSCFLDVLFSYFFFLYLHEKKLIIFLCENNFEQIEQYFIYYFTNNKADHDRKFALKIPKFDTANSVKFNDIYQELLNHIDS